jgi:hypothetical protein
VECRDCKTKSGRRRALRTHRRAETQRRRFKSRGADTNVAERMVTKGSSVAEAEWPVGFGRCEEEFSFWRVAFTEDLSGFCAACGIFEVVSFVVDQVDLALRAKTLM